MPRAHGNHQRGGRRGHYARHSEEIMRRIFESEEPYDLARQFNIPKSTVATMLKKGTPVKLPRGGRRPAKLEREHEDFLVELIENKPDLTLNEMVLKLRDRFNITVCVQTVSRHLNGLAFTLKEIRVEVDAVNNLANKRKRLQWATRYLEYIVEGYIPVFEDECNFNQHIRRGKGRSRKGERAIMNLPATRGANIHCVGSISPLHLISFNVHLGSLKAADFADCLMHIAEGLHRNNLLKVVLCIDNAPWHVQAEQQWEDVKTRFPNNDGERHWVLLRLAPYSYSCSPIERYWSVFKSGVKMEFRRRREEVIAPPAQGETLTAKRSRILSEVALAQSTPNATVQKLQAFFNNVQSNIAKARNGENVPTGR